MTIQAIKEKYPSLTHSEVDLAHYLIRELLNTTTSVPNDYLAVELNVSERTIARSLKTLEKVGIIKREYPKSMNSRLITVL